MMRLVTLVGLAFLVTGCSSTNISELVQALAQDQTANCVQVTTPYGNAIVARGTEKASVQVAGGTCTITGASVAVPVPIRVTPTTP